MSGWHIKEVEGLSIINSNLVEPERPRDLIILPDLPSDQEINPWWPWTPPLPDFPAPSQWRQRDPSWPPCMFDGLPPGIYGLVCNCPRCAIQTAQ